MDLIFWEVDRLLTWSLRSLFGGRVLAFGLDGGRVEDPRGGAVLTEVILQTFDGSVQLVGPDLEVDVHEICRGRRRRVYVSCYSVLSQSGCNETPWTGSGLCPFPAFIIDVVMRLQ